MTESSASVLAAPAPPPLHTSPVSFPLGWVLAHATPAVQSRALVDVARLADGAGPGLRSLPYADPSALVLAVTQQSDGVWNGSMLGVPGPRAAHFEGVGTICAARRLLEYGWDRESPPLVRARRILFRLLAEDHDPAFLFELRPRRADEDTTRRGRLLLREAAAATLAQAGYEGDPRLRGAARRILDRIDAYLRSPLAQKPWHRVGNKHVLAAEAAPPSIHALQMLAYMPLFRTECAPQLERICQYISQPRPRQEPQQMVGETIILQPHLVLGDWFPTRSAVEADVPGALGWLELMARLNFIRRNDGWAKVLERMLDERDRDGVWRAYKGTATPYSTDPSVWPMFPLERQASGETRWVDPTFRLGLIARIAGRPIELV